MSRSHAVAFCVHCEKSGVLERAKGALTLMSHGCDTSDFESLFGRSLPASDPVEDPILFLLQDPEKAGITSWARSKPSAALLKSHRIVINTSQPACRAGRNPSRIWTEITMVYFAYMLKTHSLSNAYITNLVKCKRVNVELPNLVEDACFHRFLSREIEEFRPRVVFCFGRWVYNSLRARMPDQRCVCLLHPSFIQNHSYTKGLSPREAILENERRIREEASTPLSGICGRAG